MSAGETFEVFYGRLVESLEIAAALMDGSGFSSNTTSPAPRVTSPANKALIEMPPPSMPSPKRAVLISAAPPVAGADESEENDDDIDHWESKPGKGDGCNKLETFLKSILPISIKVQLPNFAEPLELSRGVSGPGLIKASHVRLMAKGAIVFALANPVPEIMPEEAKAGGAMVIATGRSDYPNQINNALVFPGLFRGALDYKVTKITDTMKLRAAKNLAAIIKNPKAQKIIPDIFDKKVVPAVARAVRETK